MKTESRDFERKVRLDLLRDKFDEQVKQNWNAFDELIKRANQVIDQNPTIRCKNFKP